jgi:putative DNA primase/helicase
LDLTKNYGLRVITKENEYTKKAKCFMGTLLVPCHNSTGEVVNLERIYLNKKENKYNNRPLEDAQRKGTYYLLGEPTEQQEIILLAEGYTSAAIAHEATGYPTAITFSCGNIPITSAILREKFPQARLLIIADDDKWGDEPKLLHSGLKAAKKACSSVQNAAYILPDFNVLELPDSPLQELKPTDINDLFVLLLTKGLSRSDALDVVKQQIAFQPTSHTEILGELLKKIKKVNFRELADIEEEEKLKSQHFLILTIEHVLKIAKDNDWGICKNHDFIYVFNGAYWSLVDIDEFKTFLGAAAEAMGVDKFCARFFNFREQLYKQFIALANLPKPVQQKDSVLINLKNGTFEITPSEIKLKPFNRADFMTYQLPFEYTPEANAPIFAEYLDKVLPESQLQHILAEYLGYVFIQPTTLKLEKTLLLYGTGANGKSVFYEIVRRLLGEQNTSEYSLQSLTNDNGYFRAMIANKLVNYASEINGKLEASIFKQLVSGEPVEARLPYGKPFMLTQYAKLIFNCNELPKDVEYTVAYFRRFLIIPFEVTIPEAEQDKQLAQKIIASELSGVFNWVLQGLKRLLDQKQFTECESVKRAREQYEKESDSVKLFLEEKEYKPHPTSFVALQKLYLEYRTFCQDDGFQAVNSIPPIIPPNFKKNNLLSCL